MNFEERTHNYPYVPLSIINIESSITKSRTPSLRFGFFVGFLILVDVDENELEACRGQSTRQMYWFTARCVNRH